ncbi:IS3 family transposase [Chloroflexota bacterium]
MAKKESAESTVRNIRRNTRKKYGAEEKIRIVLEGLRGESTIAELCRREGIAQSLYYKWSKEFLEAGKQRLSGNTKRQADSEEVSGMKHENEQLKLLVAELALKNKVLKKSFAGTGGGRVAGLIRRSPEEKLEVIHLVEHSNLSVKRTLEELDIPRSTFYRWYGQYQEDGPDGLRDQKPNLRQFWNRIPDPVKAQVVDLALQHPEKSSRQLAWHFVDKMKYFISESSVYRILKGFDLVQSPAFEMVSVRDKFEKPTKRVHELWQTDFTHFKVLDWGWYYLSTILDDYSRYIIAWKLAPTMATSDVEETLELALEKSGLEKVRVRHRPRLLSDNGPAYLSKELKQFLKRKDIDHIRGAPYHPQTQGKIERWHRSMKNIVQLQNYYSPSQLAEAIDDFVEYYNNQRYHESLDNMTPASIYYGKEKEVRSEREKIKRETMTLRRQQNLVLVGV